MKPIVFLELFKAFWSKLTTWTDRIRPFVSVKRPFLHASSEYRRAFFFIFGKTLEFFSEFLLLVGFSTMKRSWRYTVAVPRWHYSTIVIKRREREKRGEKRREERMMISKSELLRARRVKTTSELVSNRSRSQRTTFWFSSFAALGFLSFLFYIHPVCVFLVFLF